MLYCLPIILKIVILAQAYTLYTQWHDHMYACYVLCHCFYTVSDVLVVGQVTISCQCGHILNFGLKASEVVIAGKLCILQNVDYRVLLLNALPMIP